MPVPHLAKSKPWSRARQTSYFSDHHGDGFDFVHGGLAGAAALGVRGKSLLEFIGQAEVVHDEAAGLVLEHAVHAGDRLHQAVAAHRLVHVHRVQARGVEPSEPHVAHEYDLEGDRRDLRKRVARASRRALLRMWGCQSVGSEAEPVITILIRPLSSSSSCQSGSRRVSFAVEVDAYPPAHADDHGLAIHRGYPLVEVRDDVLSNETQAAARRQRSPPAGPTWF